MSAICLVAAAMTVVLPVHGFTLSWQHSIEKIQWDEDYVVVGHKLQVVDARIRGTGAGMEPPPDAVFKDGIYHYKPKIGPLASFEMARSPYVKDYTICWNHVCHPMADVMGSVQKSPLVTASVCDRKPTPIAANR